MIGLSQLLTWVLIYGYPIVGATELVSSFGVPLPMTAILLVSGSLAALGSLNIVILVVVVVVCSVAGDSAGYLLGRRLGYPALERMGARSAAAHSSADAAQRYWARWSGVTIFFTRWLFTPLSGVVSILAGVMRYPYRRFFILDLAGELLAAVIFLGIGYVVGADWPYIWNYLNGLPGVLTGFVAGALLIAFGAKRWLYDRHTHRQQTQGAGVAAQREPANEPEARQS